MKLDRAQLLLDEQPISIDVLLEKYAKGDEQIPYTVSEQLHEVAHEPKRLLVFPGGHHRSLQHDLELQAASRLYIVKAARPIE